MPDRVSVKAEPSSPIDGDTVELAKQLIARRSITPDDGGCLDIVESRLASAGFTCERMDHGGVRNLWARHGRTAPVVCLAGHVDVVPPGPLEQWSSDPFVPAVRDGYLYGRGAADMKGPLAALLTAAERVISTRAARSGSLAVLLTSDEEGTAVNGTAKVVENLRGRGEAIDACILGEPTSVEHLGDMLKNGRRGSLNGKLTVKGVQCHVAYPERGRNPIHMGLPALAELAATKWDSGNEYFPPTGFQISNVHAGDGVMNVVPGTMEVLLNFRFSPESSQDELQRRVRAVLDRHGLEYELEWNLIGAPFITPHGPLVETLTAVVQRVTGRTPELSTSGGTSDGRFIASIAREVAEFGPVNDSIHKVNERVLVHDLAQLSVIYEQAIAALLAAESPSAR